MALLSLLPKHISDLDYPIWDRWMELACDDEETDALHLITSASIGNLGHVAMLNAKASLTQARLKRFMVKFMRYFTDHDEAFGTLHPPFCAPYMLEPNSYTIHATAGCLQCFRYLERNEIISKNGWYHRDKSFFMQAGHGFKNKEDLQLYVLRTSPIKILTTPIGYDTPEAGGPSWVIRLLAEIAFSRNLTTEWIRRIYPLNFKPEHTLWASYMSDSEILRLAPWIDPIVAKQLLNRGINIGTGMLRWHGHPEAGAIWNALIEHQNSCRIAVFNFMFSHPPAERDIPLINLDSANGWAAGEGYWPAWATAMKMGDHVSATWFSKHVLPGDCGHPYPAKMALVDPLKFGNVTTMGPWDTLPELSAGWLFPRNRRLIGWAAALNLTQENRRMLHEWLIKAKSALTAQYLTAFSPIIRKERARYVFDIMENIVRTWVNQRKAFERPQSKIPRLKETITSLERAREEKLNIALTMLRDVLQNSISIPAPSGGTFTLFDLPEYSDWVDEIIRSNILGPDIGVFTRLFDGPYL